MKPMSRTLLNRPSFRVMLNRAAGLLLFVFVLVLLVQIFAPSVSMANLPVIDVASLSQLTQQTIQYAQNLEKMAEQIVVLKQQVASLTGHYGMGSLGGPVNSWGSSSWDDIVNMVNTGVNPGDASQVAAYKTARAQNQTQFPPLDPSLQSTSPRMIAAYQSSYQAGITGMSAGQGTFTGVTAQLSELQVLKDKIEQTPTVKAAIDLNTTVAVKNAQINAEILRTHALALYLQGNSQNQQTNGQAAQAEFFAN
jgi:hypothetical protein